MYFYKCQSVRVIDGDSLILDIDLGLHIKTRRIARLRGINCPELRGENSQSGQRSKSRLCELIGQAQDELCCRTHLDRDDKYGRILVDLFPSGHPDVNSINSILLNEGHAALM